MNTKDNGINTKDESNVQSGRIFPVTGSQNSQDLIHQIMRCLEGKGAWPEGKEIFYGEETKWDDLSRDSPQTNGEFSVLSVNYGRLRSALECIDWIVEFGVGDSTGVDSKAGRILEEIPEKPRAYIGVDRNKRFVEQHIGILQRKFPRVVCLGIVGEFDDAYNLLVEISGHSNLSNGCLLSFGSTLSNCSPEKLIDTLRQWSRIFPNMILGQDSNTDEKSVREAYTNHAFNAFLYAGLRQVNKLLSKTVFVKGFRTNSHTCQGPPFTVQIAITAPDGVSEYFKDGREIIVFTAYKYKQKDFIALVKEANKTASITTLSHTLTESRMYSDIELELG
ncbi:hypothetical protein MKX08_009272 [Trichoderma sp. CBMAI-0020]|nr:hypothetical protein MKX08_009272 [Trichoderma sp. CBMAI-0020]